MVNYSFDLQNKILAYYQKYYQSCGLKDFSQRAQERLGEEQVEEKRMKGLQEALGFQFLPGQKHFILGAGTGGLAVLLAKKYQALVFGCEPDKIQLEIIKAKLNQQGIISAGFTADFGENLSFSSNQFDFVHCYTVLEHVQDVEKCLSEMIRIAKPGGLIYVNTPNYAACQERHYKIKWPFPPAFAPRFLSYFYLILRRKPYQFLKTINFLTERKMNKILSRQKGITWCRLARKHRSRFFGGQHLFGSKNQEILIQKTNLISSKIEAGEGSDPSLI